jgi:hypothetical protein
MSLGEINKLYEDGKHRRYQLPFAVNGGAFAIAQLLTHKDTTKIVALETLSLGMALFSIIMTTDIHTFGQKMRAADLFKTKDPHIYGPSAKPCYG